jgi:RsiW-degrading membrane proteinase PrsW (M82 family)
VAEIALVLGLLAFVGAVYAIERSLGSHTALQLSPLAALAMSAIPALLWLAYFYIQDRHEPEPTHYVAGVYLLGCFVAGPLAGFLVAQLTGPPPMGTQAMGLLSPQRLVHTFLVVALAQELSKYLVVRYTIYRSPEFDEPMDGIVYMTAAGVGFATWESYQDLQNLGRNVFLTMAAAHVVVTALAHACFAGVTGYALGRAKFMGSSSSRRALLLIAGLMAAALLNGQFHLVEAMAGAAGMDVRPWRGLALSGGFAALVFFVTSLLIRRHLAVSPFRPTSASAALIKES